MKTVKKGIHKRNIRRRSTELNDDDDEDIINTSSKLKEIRELQQLKSRPSGVNIDTLREHKPYDLEVAGTGVEHTRRAGDSEYQDNSQKEIGKTEGAFEVDIGTQFFAETNKRDEDEEMMKYIEDQLTKIKKTGSLEETTTRVGGGLNPNASSVNNNGSTAYTTPEEAALRAVPKYLREPSARSSEEMLSTQMLNGIPEIDLGIEMKIKNIEATEDAKWRLIKKQSNVQDVPSQFVPANVAVNFIHYNHLNKGAPTFENASSSFLNAAGTSKAHEHDNKKRDKATDDFHFERFKKQFKRH